MSHSKHKKSHGFQPRFLFRGHAIGISGHLRRIDQQPRELLFPAIGSVALPVSGGWVREEVRDHVQRDNDTNEVLFSVRRVIVEARGDFDPLEDAHLFTHSSGAEDGFEPPAQNLLTTVTTVQTEIEGLEINLNANKLPVNTVPVRVGKISVRWTSTHRRLAKVEPEIALDVSVTGFEVAGVPITLRPTTELLAETTHKKLKNKWSSGGFRKRCARNFGVTSNGQFPVKRAGAAKAEVVMCRVFDDLGVAPTGSPVSFPNAHIIRVEGFGTIHLGEMVISPADRRLTVMRMELGSTRGGDLMVGGSGSNGTGWPP